MIFAMVILFFASSILNISRPQRHYIVQRFQIYQIRRGSSSVVYLRYQNALKRTSQWMNCKVIAHFFHGNPAL
ncbi:hypothetical protein D915_010324 [Fasciola hepatica]|uniref:Secreted protein n=1 Tax=Fasciola hepatica TaxID=6192 RepID=A0A4E0QUU7_FASHE|nr:hypothetical protein D915_010324 [Fasciola hepatica]